MRVAIACSQINNYDYYEENNKDILFVTVYTVIQESVSFNYTRWFYSLN